MLVTGVDSSPGTATDGSGSTGVYDGVHGIAINSLTETIDGTAIYWLEITGESGGNAVAGSLALIGMYLTFTCTVVAP